MLLAKVGLHLVIYLPLEPLAAGQGFLVYVFEDTDNDGTADLPAIINVSGTENSDDATYGSIGSGDWGLQVIPTLQQ